MIDFEAAVQGVYTSKSLAPEPEEPVDEEEELRKKIFGHTLNDDGSLRCVSPSQYKNHKRCNRLWYYDKILKRKRKAPGKGAKLGKECHGREEKFLKTGVDIRGPLEKFGDEMIRPYLKHAPFNGGSMMVEEPLLDPQLVTPGGIRISGFSDVTLPPNTAAMAAVVVIDHKFKKKLAQYADTAEQLADCDPQAVIYTAWALTKWPDAVEAEFRHHNHQTEGARLNLPVSITDDRATVFAKWAKVGKYIDEDMARTALIKNVIDVPAAGDTDPGACRAYGGCDYMAECPSAPHNRYMNSLAMGTHLPELMATSRGASEPPTTQGYDLMGLLDEVMNGKTPAPASAPATTNTAPAASAAPAKAAPVEARACTVGSLYLIPGGTLGKFEGVLGDRAIFKGTDGNLSYCAPDDFVRVAPTPEAAPKERVLKLQDVDDKGKPTDTTPKIDPTAGIVPKDAPADTNPPKNFEPAPVPAPDTSTAASENGVKPGVQAGQAVADPSEKPAAKRGRPAGSKNKVASDQVIVLVNNACPAAEDLMPYVQGLCDALAKKAGIADVRLAEKGNDLAYGAWKAILAVMVKANPPPPGLYVIQRTDLTESVIEALSTVGIVSHGGRG